MNKSDQEEQPKTSTILMNIVCGRVYLSGKAVNEFLLRFMDVMSAASAADHTSSETSDVFMSLENQ